MKRFFDIIFSATGLTVIFPFMLVVLLIGWFETRSPLFRQERIGRYQKPFVVIKLRTMRPGVESIPAHLVHHSEVTPSGRFLRNIKLDELPQLWNVLKGEMSLVGPRPCLFDQELIRERSRHGVYAARPGITGLAQIRGIHMSTPRLLAETDAEMLKNLNLYSYFKYIFLTLMGKGTGDGIGRQEVNHD